MAASTKDLMNPITEGYELMTRFQGLPATVTLHSIIGGRKSQEDRMCIAPKLAEGDDNCCFCGVFDGTVGDFASNTVKDLVVPALKKTSQFQTVMQNNKTLDLQTKMDRLRDAMRIMYQASDQELLHRCGLNGKHYAASTSVTLLLWQDIICVGHLGDSRICLVYMTDDNIKKIQNECQKADPSSDSDDKENPASTVASSNENADEENAKNKKDPLDKKRILDKNWIAKDALRVDSIPVTKVEALIEGNFVTHDHKPDQMDERERIEASGGSVEYLHNHQNKPFIRGGDFQQRKILGESPMQLQYSRAFGGKDLKPFGLTATPTVNVTKRERQFIGFILASDGLWDILSADVAARTAMRAFLNGENPSEALTKQAQHGSCDNITAVCVLYDTFAGQRD